MNPVHTARVLLVLTAAMHLYYGAIFWMSPEAWMAKLSLAATSPAGITEMRAFHGGLMTAMGVTFLAACHRPWVTFGVLMMTVTFAGAVLSRSYGISVDGHNDPVIQGILWIELAGVLCGLIWFAANLWYQRSKS